MENNDTRATLVAEGGKMINRDVIYALPDPEPMGRFHNPLHHGEVLSAITDEIERRGYGIKEEQLCLTHSGAVMMGIMELTNGNGGKLAGVQASVALGFRVSTDQTSALRAVAGARVIVCYNWTLAGDMFVMAKKLTTGMDLIETVRVGFDKFTAQKESFTGNIQRLAASPLTDEQAVQEIYNAIMVEKIVAPKLLPTIHTAYFDPQPEMATLPRSMWGLHNAFTFAIKEKVPALSAQLRQTVALGKHFGV